MKLSALLNRGTQNAPGGSRADDVPIGTLSNAVGLDHPKWMPLDGRMLNKFQFPEFTALLQDMGQPLQNISSFSTNSNMFVAAHDRNEDLYPRGPTPLQTYAFSPDGRYLVLVHNTLRYSVAFSSREQIEIIVLEVPGWNVVASFSAEPFNFKDAVPIVFSPDNSFFAIGATSRRTGTSNTDPLATSVMLVRTSDWQPFYSTWGGTTGPAPNEAWGPHPTFLNINGHYVYGLAMSRDSQHMAVYAKAPIGSYSVVLWGATRFGIYIGRRSANNALRFSEEYSLELDDVVASSSTGWVLFDVRCMTFSADGRFLYCGGQFRQADEDYSNGLVIIDIEAGTLLHGAIDIPIIINAMQLTPDGDMLIIGGQRYSDPAFLDPNSVHFEHFHTNEQLYAFVNLQTGLVDTSRQTPQMRNNGAAVNGIELVDFGQRIFFQYSSLSAPHAFNPPTIFGRIFQFDTLAEVTNSDPSKASLLPTGTWTIESPVRFSSTGEYLACKLRTFPAAPHLHICQGPLAQVGISVPEDNPNRRVSPTMPVKIKYLP